MKNGRIVLIPLAQVIGERKIKISVIRQQLLPAKHMSYHNFNLQTLVEKLQNILDVQHENMDIEHVNINTKTHTKSHFKHTQQR